MATWIFLVVILAAVRQMLARPLTSNRPSGPSRSRTIPTIRPSGSIRPTRLAA